MVDLRETDHNIVYRTVTASEVSGNVNDSDNNIDLNRVDVGALFNSDSESDFDGFIFNVT